MTDEKPIQLVTSKSDKEKAEEHRANIIQSSQAFLEALTEASNDGFVAQVTFGPDAFGKTVITQFNLMKMF